MLGHAQNLVHITTEKHLYNINHGRYRFNISGRATDARKKKIKKIHPLQQFCLTSKGALYKRKSDHKEKLKGTTKRIKSVMTI